MPMTPMHELTPRDKQALAWIERARLYIEEGHSAATDALETAIVALRVDIEDLPEDELDIEAMP